MTRAQFVRWGLRREKAIASLLEAQGYLRAMVEVTSSIVGPSLNVQDAENYCHDADGCIEGAISLLGNALAAMPDDVKRKPAGNA